MELLISLATVTRKEAVWPDEMTHSSSSLASFDPASRLMNFCVMADKRVAASLYKRRSSGVNALSLTPPVNEVKGAVPEKTFENRLNFPAISAAFACAEDI